MATRTRRNAAEVAALKAEARTNTARAAEVTVDKAVAPSPAPKPRVTYTPVVRQTIEGEGRDAPTFGEAVPVPPWADFIGFSIVSQTGPGAVVLQGAIDRDADGWANNVTGQRPPQPGPRMKEREATPEERRSAIYNTRMTVTVPVPGPPMPRWPQWVRVAALVSVNADTVIEFREGA